MVNKKAWYTIFFADSGGFSSKRICGVLGWVVCLIIFICGFSFSKEIPGFADLILTVSASLLGIDSVTKIFSKN